MTAMLLTCCSSESEMKAENQATATMAKTLMVYYSYTGNCMAIVNSLASQITADQLEIQPAEKGLKYEANNYVLWINASNHSNRASLIQNWLPTQTFKTDATGISQVRADNTSSKAYTLQGTVAQTGTKGIVIQNGKKVIR